MRDSFAARDMAIRNAVAVCSVTRVFPSSIVKVWSPFDFGISSGNAIPIEERSPQEVTSFRSERVAPEGTHVYNPAFDVTPGHLITAFITECGVVQPPYADTIADLELRPFFGTQSLSGAS